MGITAKYLDRKTARELDKGTTPYVEYDAQYAAYFVLGRESGFAYASFSDLNEAKQYAAEMIENEKTH